MMQTSSIIPNASKNENELDRYRRLSVMMLDAVEELRKTISKYESMPDKDLERLAEIENVIKKDEFTIGLFGVTAAGKSTFINALLGKELMKSGLGVTSRVITELRSCDEQHPDGTTVIIYKTKKELFEELTQVIQEELGEVLAEQGSVSGYDYETKKGIERLSGLIEKHKEVDLGNVKSLKGYIQGWKSYFKLLDAEPETVDFMDNDALLHNRNPGSDGVELGEAYAVYVKRRVVYADCPFLKNGIVILDTPGFGSDIQRHTSLAEEIAKKVDVALIMTKTDYKFAQPDREFIKKIYAWQGNLRNANKDAGYEEFPLEIAFILNQIGEIVPFTDENINEQIEQLREKLERFKLANIPIFATDAACAFWSSIASAPNAGMSDREHDNYEFYSIHKDASPSENLSLSRFNSIVSEELPKYLAKVKYTSVLGKNIRDISIVNNGCRQALERRIENFQATVEEIKLKRDKFEKDVSTCQTQLDQLLQENLPFLLNTLVQSFVASELATEFQAAKKRFVDNCKSRKFKFERLTWMDRFATRMLNEIIRFIKETLSVKYCELRNNVLFNRVKSIMDRYDFSNALSLESLKKTLNDLTMPSDTIVTSVGWKQIALSPFSMFDAVVEKMAEGFLKDNQENIDTVLWSVIEHHRESFKKDVETIFTDLVQRVRNDFDETEKKLFMTKSEQEQTEKMLAAYQKEVNAIFDNLTEIREQIKRFASEQ